MNPFEPTPDGRYVATSPFSADDLLAFATELVRQRFQRGQSLSSVATIQRLLCLQLADRLHEVFGALFLDSKHRLLANEELFQGTINSTVVHTRVVVQRALQLNAAALVLYHNHPSGITEPSAADRLITERLEMNLALVDVRVLDHFIVAGTEALSFAEQGWL